MDRLCSVCNIVKDLETDFYVAHLGKTGEKVFRGVCVACFNLKQLNKKSIRTTPIRRLPIKKPVTTKPKFVLVEKKPVYEPRVIDYSDYTSVLQSLMSHRSIA